MRRRHGTNSLLRKTPQGNTTPKERGAESSRPGVGNSRRGPKKVSPLGSIAERLREI